MPIKFKFQKDNKYFETYLYLKKSFIVYLKFKLNWESCYFVWQASLVCFRGSKNNNVAEVGEQEEKTEGHKVGGTCRGVCG